MKPLHLARFLSGSPVALTLFLLAGCAGAPPEESAEPPEETTEPAEAIPYEEPMAEERPMVELKPDYPERYVVVKGDTLWDISARFLKDPWHWPQLWQHNPQVENPHLIYPGDVLNIYFLDGKPMMRVQRNGKTVMKGEIPREMAGEHYPTVKLSPRIRIEDLDQAIPTIPLDAIKPFLSRPLVIGEDELDDAPYVVEIADEHMAGGGGYRIYARGIEEEDVTGDYILVRAGQTYRDPDSNEVLGYEALYLGDARMLRSGDPSTLMIEMSNREILRGDRLIPKTADMLMHSYMPRAPEQKVNGSIISVVDGVAQIGQYQVVVLNLGRQDDIDPGHVLGVNQRGKKIKDTVEGGSVRLPDERAGEVLVFRVFERVSYALVMNATKPMHVHDKVTNP